MPQGWRESSATLARSSRIDHFGASAEGDVLFEQFGFTPDRVVAAAHAATGTRPGSSAADHSPAPDDRRRPIMSDALADLSAQDVSIWLDDISRERLRTGNLQELIDGKHVVGVTSNPTIFQKALEKGDAYDEQVRDLAVRGDRHRRAPSATSRPTTSAGPATCCGRCTTPPTARTAGCRIEVDPRLAHETEQDHRRGQGRCGGWSTGPNVMIKIPATEAGPAGDHRGHRRRHQRQRHADLRPGPLRRA